MLLAAPVMIMAGTGCQYLPVLNPGSETGEVGTPSEKAGKIALFLAGARLKGHSLAILGEETTDGMRRFSVLNISSKTITRAEVYFFALDENGNKIENSLSAGDAALEKNLVISELDGNIKPGSWGDAEIQVSELPGWTSSRFTGYRVTFDDGTTAQSSAPETEYVMGGVEASEASEALRWYDEKRK